MVGKGKLDILRSVPNEDVFRENLLVPLLEKRGVEQVTLTHGTGEKGKDIVGREKNRLDRYEWLAVVAKKGRITGSTSAVTGFQNVVNQVQEAFSYPYNDPDSKQPVSINKVLVVTNEEFLDHAKDRIVDDIGTPGPIRANTHFLDGAALAALIDESWPEFWEASREILVAPEGMSDVSALVLYVLARAYRRSGANQRGRVTEMSKEKIVSLTHRSVAEVENALSYLIQAQYVEVDRKKFYSLHKRATAGKILVDLDSMLILQKAKLVAGSYGRFSENALTKACKGEPLKFLQPFVKKKLTDLVGMGYVEIDEARGRKNYLLKLETFENEKLYFDCALKYQWRAPAE